MTQPLTYINFHGLGPKPRPLAPGEDAVWVEQQPFEQMLDVLQDRPDVHLTFDDGNRSDLTLALPALSKRNLKATFFVVAGRINQPHFLSSDDLQALIEAGMTIGCHGMEHRPWRRLSSAELHEELVVAREQIAEAVGQPINLAACPFGDYDRKVIKALRRANYQQVFTSDRGPASSRAWLTPRNTVHHNDTTDTVLAMLAPWPMARRGCARLKQLVKAWR